MKRVLVVGEINVDLVLQGAHAFPIRARKSSSTTWS
jgi:sugar/nucleoside kinase (ribokinase family)